MVRYDWTRFLRVHTSTINAMHSIEQATVTMNARSNPVFLSSPLPPLPPEWYLLKWHLTRCRRYCHTLRYRTLKQRNSRNA